MCSLVYIPFPFWIFIFFFLNVCPSVCVYSLTCDQCLVGSWVPASTGHMLTVFRYVYSIQIISHRWEENSSINIFTICHQNDYFFLAPSRSLECWRTMGGRTELKRGGCVGRKQCYCTAQTPGWQEKRTQQDFSSNEMCVKKLIQARVIWHTQTKVPATRQTSELTGDWSPESFVQLSLIFLTP